LIQDLRLPLGEQLQREAFRMVYSLSCGQSEVEGMRRQCDGTR
jgi:hypothetical protein